MIKTNFSNLLAQNIANSFKCIANGYNYIPNSTGNIPISNYWC
ncbi:hypothetical protein ACFP3I_25120 [Chryseobacterium arachidis]